MASEKPLARECAAEIVGTFFLVFFGTGSVYVAAIANGLNGLFQVGIVWGLAIALTIYAVSAISGAHLNPAVTIAVAVLRDFPKRKILPYVGAQLVGAFAAAALLYALFGGVLAGFEKDNKIARGAPGSERTAMVFGEYFPNPAMFPPDPKRDAAAAVADVNAKVTELQAMAAEAVGTALLVFFIFAMTDARNRNRPDGTLFAPLIGLTITILICVIAPLTQAGFNPARDFGPRLFAYFAGWGSVAIPGPRGGFFTVYILSPIVGGVVGGMIYDLVIRPREALATPAPSGRTAVDGKGLVTETTPPAS